VGRISVGLHTQVLGTPLGLVNTWKAGPKLQAEHKDKEAYAAWSPERKVNASDVFWMTLVMAAACGLGAVPFFFIEKLSKVWAAMANAVACGVMLAASFDLLHEAEGYGSVPLILGLVVGCLFIKFMQDWLHGYEDIKFEGFSGANAQKITLFVGIMAAHAIGEGSGVGALSSGIDGSTCLASSPLCFLFFHRSLLFGFFKAS
jgi:hypothetical protein